MSDQPLPDPKEIPPAQFLDPTQEFAWGSKLLEATTDTEGCSRMWRDGFDRLEWAAGRGHLPAITKLGQLQRTASPMIPEEFLDESQGADLLRKAALGGCLEAQLELAEALECGKGAWKDLAEAKLWYRAAAVNGHAPSQKRLMDHYFYGDGAGLDVGEIVGWVREAADRGEAEAHYQLGRCLRFGEGVDVDYLEAVVHFRTATASGEDRAYHHLGELYFSGLGLEQDYSEAIRCFKKSNLLSSHYYLGLCHRDGLGVPVDYPKALEEFRCASSPGGLSFGDRRAMHCLARMHEENSCGCGPAHEAGWYRWYLWSAEKGYSPAQFDIGRLFESGIDAAFDLSVALRWYREAAAAGHDEARAALVRLGAT